jgi:hypothetical protein
MSINIAVGEEAVKAQEEAAAEEPRHPSMEMVVRKTMDGNIMILDHLDMDIVVMPQDGKVLALAKDNFDDDVYDSQDRLFKYLSQNGVVMPDSIRGGNVYGSLEGKFPTESASGADPLQTVVFSVGKWIEEERPYFAYTKAIEDQETERLTNPDDQASTELGEVPQERVKGVHPSDPLGAWYKQRGNTPEAGSE